MGGKHSADLEAELALCPPFPGAPPPRHLTPITTAAAAAISREEQEEGGKNGRKNAEASPWEGEREWK